MRQTATDWSRLPRACGDRPDFESILPSVSTAPPRMRGSTREVVRWFRQTWGSPAHAGIDPGLPGSGKTTMGLPRACGDRPKKVQGHKFSIGAPPRMRGSTRAGQGLPAADAGSPAHAGIDPLELLAEAKPLGLPRACGDRPRRRPFF